MLAQSLRVSSLAMAARQQTAMTFRRTFIVPSAVRQADLVQDMYLKELKAYKAPAVKASDAEGQVQKFRLPTAPASPEEANLADDLKAYETQAVEVEGQAETGAPAAVQDWFEEPAEDDAPAHH